jgi:hypothetical protein
MIFRYALWRLERQQRAYERETQAKINAFQKKKVPLDVLDDLYKARNRYAATIEVIRLRAHSEMLRSKAQRLNIPVPPESQWETDGEHNPIKLPHMTPAMQTDLRRAIRQEQRERREMWTIVVKDVVVPIGGILISVLSLMIAWAALHIKR